MQELVLALSSLQFDRQLSKMLCHIRIYIYNYIYITTPNVYLFSFDWYLQFFFLKSYLCV